MTKEELKQEAEVYSYKLYHSKAWNPGEDMLVKAYLAGAEPREKRIAELIALINAERKRQEKCDDVHLRKIADLEEENAELKEQCSILADCNTCVSDCKTENIEMKNNLTKAKEIIREFVEWANWQGNSKCPSFKSIQDKAEQFLKESE